MAPSIIRRGGRLLAAAAVLFSLVLGAGVLDDSSALVFSDVVYPVVALGAAALLILGAMHRSGRDRISWSLLGVGVAFSGLGELTWAWYELVLGLEPPFPGLPDVFYLASYPMLAMGLWLAPRLAVNGYQRAQQIIDGVAITAGISVVAWITVLQPMYSAAADTALSELVVGAAYPLGDILLVSTIGIVGFRRSTHLQDRALWLVIGALLVTAFGDIVFMTQDWAGTYVSGGWVDATWLAAYGLYALGASLLPEPLEQREVRDRRLGLWSVLTPVAVLAVMGGIRVVGKLASGDTAQVLTALGFASLGALVIGRILLVLAEDRHLVDDERRQLISVVSHELRTPLTAVKGYLDVTLDDWDSLLDTERREMIEVAREQSHLVTRIVTDLIAASRETLHATELASEPTRLSPAVHDVVAALGLRPEVTVSVDPELGVLADRERLAQILTNLIGNAHRYGRGAITLRARKANGQIELAVHDNGPGVPPRYRETIWEKFERGQHRFDAATPGSGLGLAIVKSLAIAHGGQVGYRTSEKLGGACFWVRLPAAPTLFLQPEPIGLRPESLPV